MIKHNKEIVNKQALPEEEIVIDKKIIPKAKRVRHSFYKEENYIPDNRKTNDEFHDMIRNMLS